MQKYKKPETSSLVRFPNPFSNSLIINVKTRSNPNQFEHDDGIINHVTYTVESDSITKLYTNPNKRLDMCKIPPQACKIYLWIMYTLDSGRDYLWINKHRIMIEMDIKSVNTVNQAIEDLMIANVISPTTIKEVYWINPFYFFKGDRIGKYPKSVVVDKSFLE